MKIVDQESATTINNVATTVLLLTANHFLHFVIFLNMHKTKMTFINT